ncbi:MAG: hypothetical protein IIT49_00820 [Clostridia bacterium]|nr:hypothetical protein [Clostridia bacterium]
MYRGDIANNIRLYGRKCVIQPYDSDSVITVKAILNPILHKTKLYLTNNRRADGYSDCTHYLYIGEPKLNLADFPPGTVLRCSGQAYTIKYAALYTDGKTTLYCWAILEKYMGGFDV